MCIRDRPWVSLLVALALVGFYGVRAAVGWMAGPAYSQGKRLAAQGRYEEALPRLERGAAGTLRAATLWLRGQVRVGIWQYRMDLGEDPGDWSHLLNDAHREYTEALSMSPASGWYWASLGDLYAQQERLERLRGGMDLALLRGDARARLGRPGRLAIGMTRLALRREPTVFTFHDQLALILWDVGLRDEALAAVRRSAEVQPVFRLHAYETLGVVPAELLDAFAEGARAASGKTPFLRRTLYLLALGRIEVRRGNLEAAEADLRAALEAGAERLNRAEAHYYLGLVLWRQGHPDEALKSLERAKEHENFEAAALVAQAGICEEAGRIEEAMHLLRGARRLQPRNLGHVLEYARLARVHGFWRQAEEALHWGVTVAPGDSRAWRALVTLYLESGRYRDAATALATLVQLQGETEEVQRFRERIQRGDES